jgi:hypothetical protein
VMLDLLAPPSGTRSEVGSGARRLRLSKVLLELTLDAPGTP